MDSERTFIFVSIVEEQQYFTINGARVIDKLKVIVSSLIKEIGKVIPIVKK